LAANEIIAMLYSLPLSSWAVVDGQETRSLRANGSLSVSFPHRLRARVNTRLTGCLHQFGQLRPGHDVRISKLEGGIRASRDAAPNVAISHDGKKFASRPEEPIWWGSRDGATRWPAAHVPRMVDISAQYRHRALAEGPA
jgi:hypothetical protein